MTRWRRCARGPATQWLLALAVAAALAWPVPAWAHANFERSDPPANSSVRTAPQRLRLWFTEALEPGFSEVTVLDAQGQRVDRDDSLVVPADRASMTVSVRALERGTYTVAWRALSAVDGHVTRGAFTLLIGVAGTPPPLAPPVESTPNTPFEAAVRWFGYLAAALLTGTLAFRLLVLEPVAVNQQVATLVLPPAIQRLRRLLWASWTVLSAATLAALVVQGAAVTGAAGVAEVLASLPRLITTTRSGKVWTTRVGLLAGLLILLIVMRRMPNRALWGTAGGLALAVLLTTSLNSHAAAYGGSIGLAVDWVHLVGVSVWVGGLFCLALALPPALAALPQVRRRAFLAGVIPRFSSLAVTSVVALVGAGTYLAWLHVRSIAALRETLYGTSLLIKLAIVVPLLVLGAVNLLVIRPRLAESVARKRGQPRAERLAGHFSRTVRAEVVLASLVLLATGILASLAPAGETYKRLVASRPLAMSAQAGAFRITLTVTPARPGINAFAVEVRDVTGIPVEGADRVDLRFTYLDQAIGTRLERTREAGGGRHVATAPAVSVEGLWQVEVIVRVRGLQDTRTAFRFRVSATAAAEDVPQATRAHVNFQTVGGTALGLAGAIMLIYTARAIKHPWRRRGLAAAGAAIGGVGLWLLLVSAGFVGSSSATQNPYPPTAESLVIGERIYRAQCQSCHGVEGRGDGPVGRFLDPPPADFRIHMAAGHTDAQLFNWLSNGMAGTAMPAFRDRLTVEERWHVLNFIRTFAPTDR